MKFPNPFSKKKPARSGVKSGKGTNKKSHKKLFIWITVGIVVATAMGSLGYMKYKEQSLKAEAAAFKKVLNTNGVTASACKVASPYGYVVKVIATKPRHLPNNYGLQVWTYKTATSSPQIHHRSSFMWWWNVVTATEAYAGKSNAWYMIEAYGYRTNRISLLYTPNC